MGLPHLAEHPAPYRVSAFEKAIRSYADNPAENVITPVIGATFDSLGGAYDFYNLYSWEKGFVILYGKSRLNLERTPRSISRTTGGTAMACTLRGTLVR